MGSKLTDLEAKARRHAKALYERKRWVGTGLRSGSTHFSMASFVQGALWAAQELNLDPPQNGTIDEYDESYRAFVETDKC